MSTILVTARSFRAIPGRHMRLLEESGHRLILPEADGPFKADELVSMVLGVDAIIAGNDQIDRSVIEAADRLIIIGKHGTGTDNIDVEAAQATGVAIVTAPGANAESVAELAVAMMLAALRRLKWHHEVVAGDGWSRSLGRELGACTVALVGFGKVGQHVAKLARSFGAAVRVVEPSPDLELLHELSCVLMPLQEAVHGADVLSLHCPLTEGSRGLIDAAVLSRLAHAAILVNTARAALVDDQAVLDALESDRLSCYATDVYREEPPKDRKLAGLDGALCTPHIGAYTVQAVERTGTAVAHAVLDALTKGQQ